jgi:glutamate synthase domain-containing protein 1
MTQGMLAGSTEVFMNIDIIKHCLLDLADRAGKLADELSTKGAKPLTQDDRKFIRQAMLPSLQEALGMAEVFFIQGDFERMDEAIEDARTTISYVH